MKRAQANLAKIPESLTDEQVVLLADIASTGFAGAESGKVRIGDTVVVFAQAPIGLCATAGAKLMGAARVIGVDGDPNRAAMALRMGAELVLDPAAVDVVAEIKRLTTARGPMSPSRRSACRRPSRAPCAASVPAGRSPAWASTPASCRCRTRRSRPASAITPSSRPCAPAARNG